MAKYRVVQPWGPDKARQATLQSEHATITEAFAAIDAMSAQMVRTDVAGDALTAEYHLEWGSSARHPPRGSTRAWGSLISRSRGGDESRSSPLVARAE